MVDLSTLEVHIRTNKDNIDEVCSYISQFMKTGDLVVEKFDNSNLVPELNPTSKVIKPECTILDNDNIVFKGFAEWSGPAQFFIDIANKFNVHIDYYDAEVKSDFFQHISAKGSLILSNTGDSYYSLAHAKHIGVDRFSKLIDWYWNSEEENDEIERVIKELKFEARLGLVL